MMLDDARIIGLGFALGLHHALDSDHLVAVSTIISRSRASIGPSASARCGASGTPSRSW